jgi:hypothetical protein
MSTAKYRRDKKCFTESWSLIPQKTIDNLCKVFPMKLRLCLESEGQSISNLLWMLGEKEKMEEYENLICPQNCWSNEEDERFYQQILTHGTKWKFFEQFFPKWNSFQIKQR